MILLRGSSRSCSGMLGPGACPDGPPGDLCSSCWHVSFEDLARSERGGLRLRRWQAIVSSDDKECPVCGEASLTRLWRKMRRLSKAKIRVKLGQENYPLVGRRGKRAEESARPLVVRFASGQLVQPLSIFILPVNGSHAGWATIRGVSPRTLDRVETSTSRSRTTERMTVALTFSSPLFPIRGFISCFILSDRQLSLLTFHLVHHLIGVSSYIISCRFWAFAPYCNMLGGKLCLVAYLQYGCFTRRGRDIYRYDGKSLARENPCFDLRLPFQVEST